MKKLIFLVVVLFVACSTFQTKRKPILRCTDGETYIVGDTIYVHCTETN